MNVPPQGILRLASHFHYLPFFLHSIGNWVFLNTFQRVLNLNWRNFLWLKRWGGRFVNCVTEDELRFLLSSISFICLRIDWCCLLKNSFILRFNLEIRLTALRSSQWLFFCEIFFKTCWTEKTQTLRFNTFIVLTWTSIDPGRKIRKINGKFSLRRWFNCVNNDVHVSIRNPLTFRVDIKSDPFSFTSWHELWWQIFDSIDDIKGRFFLQDEIVVKACSEAKGDSRKAFLGWIDVKSFQSESFNWNSRGSEEFDGNIKIKDSEPWTFDRF